MTFTFWCKHQLYYYNTEMVWVCNAKTTGPIYLKFCTKLADIPRSNISTAVSVFCRSLMKADVFKTSFEFLCGVLASVITL